MIRCLFTKGKLVRRVGLLLASTYLYSNALAVEIAVPPPKEMIMKSDIIAIGHADMSDDSVVFVADDVLKGAIEVGKQYRLRSPFPAESFAEKQLISVTRGEQFMLVGRWNKDKAEVQPIYGLSSAWPQGTTAELLSERTLAGCIAFVRATLQSQSTPGAGPFFASPKNTVNPAARAAADISGTSPIQFNSSPSPTHAAAAPTTHSVSWIIWIIIALVILLTAGLLLRFSRKRKGTSN